MPEENVILRAREDAREGKAPSTQAGEFVREEIDRKHGARSVKQAIAVGLSKARKAGVKLPPNPNNPGAGQQVTRKQQGKKISDSSRNGSQASLNALRRESTRKASPRAVSAHVKAAAKKRGSANRHPAARKVAKTRRNTSGADTR